MDNAVVEFGQFCIVPAVGCPDKIAGDALEPVDCVATAFGAFLEIFSRILVSAAHAAVAVVVD